MVGLFVAMIISTLAELATLGAVLPFLTLLAEPNQAFKYPLLQKLFFVLGWGGDNNILVPASVLFAIVAVCAAVIRMLFSWISFKFTFGLGVDISLEIYRRTLYQPYKYHVARNSSEIIAGLNKAQAVIFGVLNPLVLSASSLIFSLAILGALIRIDPVTASLAGLGFAVIYLLITFFTRRQLHANSKVIAENETQRIQVIQEGLGGIRDIIIDGTQVVYIRRFQNFDDFLRHAQAVNNFIGSAPRYLIKSFGMVLIAALAYWLSLGAGGLSAAVPVLGALAIGAQKLLRRCNKSTLAGRR